MTNERAVGDPNMEAARLFADHLGPVLALPASLTEPEKRAALVHTIDGPLVGWARTR